MAATIMAEDFEARVLTALAGINGAGAYNFDLSATGAVQRGGSQTSGHNPPTARIYCQVAQGDHAQRLGWLSFWMTFQIELQVAATGSTGVLRKQAAWQIVSDVFVALRLETVAATAGSLRAIGACEQLLSVDYIGGDELDSPGGVVTAHISLRLRYESATGI